MRVRTAGVSPNKASALKPLFDYAVERHLAWVVGTGHQYADLEKVAKKAGYLFVTVPEPEEHWVAVRADLVHEDIVFEGNGLVSFAFSNDALGSVGIDLDGATFNKVGDKDRIRSVEVSDMLEMNDFVYTEVLYSVVPLKN
jgi:hypothetical protein